MNREEYPIGRGGVLRSHQLLEACARSSLVREQYLNVFVQARGRFAELVAQAQATGLISTQYDPQAISTLIIALVVGLRTLHDVGAPIDLPSLAAVFNVPLA